MVIAVVVVLVVGGEVAFCLREETVVVVVVVSAVADIIDLRLILGVEGEYRKWLIERGESLKCSMKLCICVGRGVG